MFRLLLIPFLLLLSGCADLEVIMPNPRVEAPEVRGGEYKWKFSVAGGDNHAFEATDNAGERPPDMDHPTVRGYADVHPGAAFTVLDNWEIGAELNTLGKGGGLVTKLQIFGDGTGSAKKGNLPVAIFGRIGTAQGSNSGDQSTTFGAGGYNWDGEVHATYAQAGASMGYRVGDHALLYWGGAYSKYHTESKINQDPHQPADPGGSYSKNQDGSGFSAAFGAMFSWRVVQFWVSGEKTRVDYGPTDAMDDIFLHTGVQFTPGSSEAKVD